jgi:hypothetical protein
MAAFRMEVPQVKAVILDLNSSFAIILPSAALELDD